MDQKCLEEKSTSAFLACRALNGHVRLADVTFTRRVTEGISQALPIHCALVVLPSRSLRLLSLWTLLSSTFIFSFHYFICLFICERRMIRPNVLVRVRAISQREKSYNTEMAVAFCSYTPFMSKRIRF